MINSFKLITLSALLFFNSNAVYAQACEEELPPLAYTYLSYKLHQVFVHKTDARLNRIHDDKLLSLHKEFAHDLTSEVYHRMTEQLDRVRAENYQNRIQIIYEDPSICDDEEVQEIISAILGDKKRICQSDDVYVALDDLKDTLADDAPEVGELYRRCPSPTDLKDEFEKILPKGALNFDSKKACLLVHKVMKRKTAACVKEGIKTPRRAF